MGLCLQTNTEQRKREWNIALYSDYGYYIPAIIRVVGKKARMREERDE